MLNIIKLNIIYVKNHLKFVQLNYSNNYIDNSITIFYNEKYIIFENIR
jgi:hypothetical protein